MSPSRVMWSSVLVNEAIINVSFYMVVASVLVYID